MDQRARPADTVLRPARPEDLPALCALVNRCEAHDGVPRVLALEELAEEWAGPDLDLAADARVVEVYGSPVAWAYVWNPPPSEVLARAYLHGWVAPEHRGQGIGRALLAWARQRAEERMADVPDGVSRHVRVDAYDWLDDHHRLFRAAGFRPVRWFEELIRPLDELPEPEAPAGVALERWPEGEDEALRAVRNAAFGDHWGTTPMTVEGWDNLVHGHGTRLDLSCVARDAATGQVVAVCVNSAYPEDEEVTGRRDAWIQNVGTLGAWRGRGLATALLVRSMHAFRDAGFTHAVLGVDADNPTGAFHLYRRLGFETLHRSITYEP